jgi:hypothetical protein
MQRDDTPERRNPFASLDDREPAQALGLVSTSAPAVLTKRPTGQRKTPVRPSEQRRRSRQVTVTFSDANIPERLRNLAKQWEMTGPDGRRPNVSGLVEYLLLPRLGAAIAGEIPPPNGREK